MSIQDNLKTIETTIPNHVTLVAVSKTKPVEDLQEAYEAGIRDFGENKIQEMCDKYEVLPKDIRWHMIGHVQTNKVKYMAPFVHLIHGVDSLKLLKEINKQAEKNNRIIDVLLQQFIADEETKFGLDVEETRQIMQEEIQHLPHVRVVGLMGMATFTEDKNQIRNEFKTLKSNFDFLKNNFENITILSMGMSGDYQIAIEEGSTMVRIGSSIFGHRNYSI
ncbi:YggS family pyridoxal phosphate-dependent enzyme [Empedobacter stercoris]|uniref:YggS family pyridoxal phosphate-dependent enzyme n=1 Tax=Empedobacter stercoris TaxID=1628248 RepID=UPI0016623A17|nr:YggS family pyridoxal phosphate-dependent enzyme [Empedobacter stercoris]MCA4775830.1 YggS family pyridoxal phosphate-dependent enzyme [Empedobacter stercoris]MCA4782210.1 YggS family pyridoxal phosphate-dependent enzyme [Empedobacter stercoris]MCA4809573.1 YggS family pyridoxal phosphate-dependent enzyme [Empedobacter stercoris]QNT13496.1 YggS family pyridoxal phosphate-dependent enzyme [Empedobacter stercoris]